MSFIEQLQMFFETKPLVVLQFGEKYRTVFAERGHDRNRLTFVQPHEVFQNIRPPMLCLIQLPDGQRCEVF
jgi:hypothetical protein